MSLAYPVISEHDIRDLDYELEVGATDADKPA